MKKLLFLMLLPVFGLLLSNNTFALKYDYDGLYTADIFHPDVVSESGSYAYDLEQFDPYAISNSFASPLSNSITWTFPSNYDFLNTKPFDSVSYHLSNDNTLSTTQDERLCHVNISSSNKYYAIRNLLKSGKTVYYSTRSFAFKSWTGVNPCYTTDTLLYSYDEPLFNDEWLYTNWDSTYDRNLPPWGNFFGYIGTDVLPLNSTDSTDGLVRSSDFSPSRLVENNNMIGFKSLSIPLFTSDGFFMDYNNLTNGRQLEWHFTFYIQGGATIGSNSSFKLELPNSFFHNRPSNSSNVSLTYNCTYDTVDYPIDDSVEGAVTNSVLELNVTCPVTLNADYAGLYPYLTFSNSSDSSFFSEYSPYAWFWSNFYLVTDNDYTPAYSFNSSEFSSEFSDWSPLNGTDVPGDVSWTDSLIRLFSFGLPVSSTPLGLILGGFSNQTNCANIPTLASMLHSNETQVCPFFPASVRTIVTPVLGLFSVCLVFGAFMSWLGGSSGNFIEDSSTHSFGGFKIAKGGKK